MPSPNPPRPDGDAAEPTTPTTPRRASAAKGATPNHGAAARKASAGQQTPKSAPAAARGAAAGEGGVRKRSQSQRPPPTLLGDFLLGKQSPARVAATREAQRRKGGDTDAVRAELRRQMRRETVQRLQQPGGVRDRVKAWQKTNASAMVKGDPEAAPTEPTDVGIHVDEKSVTEADRVRIKMRKKLNRAKHKPTNRRPKDDEDGSDDTDDGSNHGSDDSENDEPGGDDDHAAETPRVKGPPPKKRIVSDDNWMRRQKRASVSPAPAPATPKSKPEGSPIPKDFLQRTAANPTIQNKIKDWTKRVEMPESPRVKKHTAKPAEAVTVEEDGGSSGRRSAADDAIRARTSRPSNAAQETMGVKPAPEKKRERKKPAGVDKKDRGDDDGIRITPLESSLPDDGIRITPLKSSLPDDGIRITPLKSSLPDDGIRVRPTRKSSMDDMTVRAESRTASRDRSTRASSSRAPSSRRDEASPSERIEVVEELESPVGTPTRRSKSKRAERMKPVARATSLTETRAGGFKGSRSSSGGSDASTRRGGSHDGSCGPSSAPAKSLADIPFGYSAFSELDLSLGAGANRTKRPKAQRNPSFKAVPNVLKKVVSEGKKILQDKVDPPKLVINQPPSIESWLDNTVDPFIETPGQRKTSIEDEWKKDVRKRSVSETRQKAVASSPPATEASKREDHESADPQDKKQERNGEEAPKREPEAATTPKSSGLKRSKATRGSPSSPLKSAPKKPFREILKDAFRGESGGHVFPPIMYASVEDERDVDRAAERDDWDKSHSRRRSSGGGPRRRTPSPEPAPSSVESSVTESATASSATPAPAAAADLPKRRPPTNGLHELSTIASEASFSTHASDSLSTISQTTITQATAMTKATTDLSRSKSHRSASLKRRLTKHSDLVSVLSLPGDAQLPARAKSIKVARSLHRKTSKLDSATLEDLLSEFAEDENLYQRELKTLVDGVVPVLLTQAVHGTQGSSSSSRNNNNAAELFGPGGSGEKADTMAKAVVNMGVSLEKLKNSHRRVPLRDAPRLLAWLEDVHPVYNSYLDAWRLGFQDIIVNLAPASDRLDDEDSLVNAMSRNEDGDVLDENGERVDVAHLLKRPLVRIKWMAKFARGVKKCLGGSFADQIVAKFEELLAKTRRRHREEVARKTDEDANNTDATRTRDLRNLAALDHVFVDQTRQVNAKDSFSLELLHSNGQRLECQVELVFRDKQDDPDDGGDVLIRETGSGGRSWLLFPPVLASQISVRKGEGRRGIVAMVRGLHEGDDWHQLLNLQADHEDTVADWLALLSTVPVPPSAASAGALALTRRSAPSPSAGEADVPVGEQKFQKQPQSPYPSSLTPSPSQDPPPRLKAPSRYHQRNQSLPPSPTPASPVASRSPSYGHLPASPPAQPKSRHPLPQLPPKPSSRPLREDMRPDPAKLVKTPPSSANFREDGAPPPPVHRTLGPPKQSPTITPPVELSSTARVKRRMSSPLKHEYHPSDVSSDDSTPEGSGSESDSSADELDEDDVPDTLPGISIRKPEPAVAGSVISECSLTPSNSASQAGLPNLRAATPEYTLRFVAVISYWSNKKGLWKELGDQACSIVITPGLIEAHPLDSLHSAAYGSGLQQSSGPSDAGANGGDLEAGAVRPLIALDLTPLVMIRQSTVIDLEIRSPVRSYSKYSKMDSSIFRFRALSPAEANMLYTAVHRSRMNNAKFRALEEEARFRSFGQQQQPADGDGGDNASGSSRRRRSWFGRKSSYRASTRAPSQSQGSASSVSASSFLKRLTGGGDLSFDIDKSSVDKQSRAGSAAGGGGGSGGAASLYTSSASSSATPPRSPSVSLAESSSRGIKVLGNNNLKIRCHLQISPSKWEDHGNCLLSISRPPPGVRQELRIFHGMEKRILVTAIPKKDADKPLVVLDVVVGSGCFSRLAARGIVLNVWEDIRDENNRVGSVPKAGGMSGKVKKWCFQCSSAAEASWIYGLVAQEVMIS